MFNLELKINRHSLKLGEKLTLNLLKSTSRPGDKLNLRAILSVLIRRRNMIYQIHDCCVSFFNRDMLFLPELPTMYYNTQAFLHIENKQISGFSFAALGNQKVAELSIKDFITFANEKFGQYKMSIPSLTFWQDNNSFIACQLSDDKQKATYHWFQGEFNEQI